MANSKLRKQRLRQRRQQAGLKAALVWLTPEGQAAMAALRQPGETVDTCVNRALVTLQQVLANGTSPVAHHRSTRRHVSGVHAGWEEREGMKHGQRSAILGMD
jgi:hypothetical protein